MRRFQAVVLLVGAVLMASPAYAIITPFSRRVNDSVEAAVQHFREGGVQGGSGAWATGLSMLCMLEKRAGADFFSPHVGYDGMDEDDQERVRRAVRNIIDTDTAFSQGRDPSSYGSGNKLMALALYAATGGGRRRRCTGGRDHGH